MKKDKPISNGAPVNGAAATETKSAASAKAAIPIIRLEAGRAVVALETLQAISNRFDEKTPFFDSYEVTRLTQRISNDADVQATDKMRRELIVKFGDKDPQGNSRIAPTSARWQEFANAYEPIANEMLELQVRRIHPKCFKHLLGVQPAQTQAIWPFLLEASEDLAELVVDAPEPPQPDAPQPPALPTAPPPAPAKEQ